VAKKLNRYGQKFKVKKLPGKKTREYDRYSVQIFRPEKSKWEELRERSLRVELIVEAFKTKEEINDFHKARLKKEKIDKIKEDKIKEDKIKEDKAKEDKVK